MTALACCHVRQKGFIACCTMDLFVTCFIGGFLIRTHCIGKLYASIWLSWFIQCTPQRAVLRASHRDAVRLLRRPDLPESSVVRNTYQVGAEGQQLQKTPKRQLLRTLATSSCTTVCQCWFTLTTSNRNIDALRRTRVFEVTSGAQPASWRGSALSALMARPLTSQHQTTRE